MSDRRRSRKSWTWTAIAAAVVLIAAGVIAFFVWDRAPARKDYPDYSAMLAFYPKDAGLRMPTKDELKRLAKLWPTVPPEENAAFYYMQAVSLVKSTGAPDGSATTAESYMGDSSAFEPWVRDNGPAIAALRAGTRKSACVFPRFFDTKNNGFNNLDYLAGLRNAARIMADAGFLAELKAQPDEAALCYLDCLRFGKHVRQGVLIENLVGVAIGAIGCRNLEQLIANAPLSEDSLRKVIDVCRACEPAQAEMAQVIGREYEHMDANAGKSFVLTLLLMRERSAIRQAKRDFDKPLPETMKEPEALAPMEGQSMRKGEPGASLWHARLQLARHELLLRATGVRAALALYRKRHGVFPEQLTALVPDILPALPVDPFTGAPLRYARTPDGWRLWSVGPDLKDDGGVAGWRQLDGNFWYGTDYVFLSGVPSTIERMAAHLKPASSQSTSSPPGQRTPPPPPNPAAASDPLELTPLHHAARRGDVAGVESLLAKGADVNARGIAMQTPLHLAANRAVADLLLSKGAEVDARDRWDRTPLFWAAGAGRKDVAEALLAKGAKPDAVETPDRFTATLSDAMRTEVSRRYGLTIPPGAPRTPVMRACEQGHQDIADVIQQQVK